MTIYIEDCIIENFFVTFLLLQCINKIFVKKNNKFKIFVASLVAGIIATFYPLLSVNNVILVVFKLCAGFVIIYIYDGNKKLFAKYVSFILLTSLFAGINLLVYYLAYGTLNIADNFATHVLIIMLYIIYYLFGSCLNLIKKNLTITNFVYNIEINNNNNNFVDTAFLDSGNTLIDNTDGSPVFIINYKLFNKLYKDIAIEDILSKNFKNLKNPHYVKSNYASGSSKILVFDVDQLQILNNNKPLTIKNAKIGLVYAKFDKNFGCNMLLNINAFMGLYNA